MRKLTRVVKSKKFGLVMAILAVGTIAFMMIQHTSAYTFPQTPVLDNFNRAGTTAPPSASWTNGTGGTALLGDNCGLQLSGDSVTAKANTTSNSQFCAAEWNAATFTDSEVYTTLGGTLNASGEDISLYTRISGATTNTYYEVEFDTGASNNIKVSGLKAGSGHSITGTPMSQSFSSGDSLGVETTGTGATVTIKVWRKPAAGSWTLVGTATDTDTNRVTTAGNVGMEVLTDGSANPANLITIDDFGGGSLTPDPPTLSAPANNATGVFTSPTFKLSTADYGSNYVNYEIQVCSTSNCSSVVTSICQITFNGCTSTGQTGWSGQDANSGAAYATTSSSGTTATYIYQPAHLTPNTQYWWRAYAIDPGGSNTASAASSIFTFTTSQVPAAPSLINPSASSTGNPTLPIFQLSSTDPESDYLQYYIQLYDATACGGSQVGSNIDQTSSQTNWQGQDANSGSAYNSVSSTTSPTFPSTQILDNFNRGGANALSATGNWSFGQADNVEFNGSNDSDTVDPATNTNNVWGGDYWSVSTFGPDTEVYATNKVHLASSGNAIMDLYARQQTPAVTSTWNAYGLTVNNSATNNVLVNQVHHNVETQLGAAITQVVGIGDSFGMKVTGTGATVTIEVWYKPSGGSWTSLGTRTDSGANRVTAAGYIGADVETSASGTQASFARLDDFGGGTAAPINSTTARYQYAGTPLTSGHLYSWRAKAIDPGGSQTFGSLSSCQDFTVGSSEVQIQGGTTIQGGSTIQ